MYEQLMDHMPEPLESIPSISLLPPILQNLTSISDTSVVEVNQLELNVHMDHLWQRSVHMLKHG